MKDWKQLQKDIEALGYKCHGLWTESGQCLLRHNLAKDTSNLPQIIKMLQSLPPGRYFVNCSNGAGKKYAHFDFPVIMESNSTSNISNASEIVKSPAGHDSNIDPVTFGRLQSENEMLKAKLEEMQALSEKADEEEEEEEEEEKEPEPSLQDKAIEALLPVLPTLADKVIGYLDRVLLPPVPLADKAPAAPQQIQLDPASIQQLAEVVKKMVIQDLAQMQSEENHGGF